MAYKFSPNATWLKKDENEKKKNESKTSGSTPEKSASSTKSSGSKSSSNKSSGNTTKKASWSTEEQRKRNQERVIARPERTPAPNPYGDAVDVVNADLGWLDAETAAWSKFVQDNIYKQNGGRIFMNSGMQHLYDATLDKITGMQGTVNQNPDRFTPEGLENVNSFLGQTFDATSKEGRRVRSRMGDLTVLDEIQKEIASQDKKTKDGRTKIKELEDEHKLLTNNLRLSGYEKVSLGLTDDDNAYYKGVYNRHQDYARGDMMADLHLVDTYAKGGFISQEDYRNAKKRLEGYFGDDLSRVASSDPSDEWMYKYIDRYDSNEAAFDEYIKNVSGLGDAGIEYGLNDYISYMGSELTKSSAEDRAAEFAGRRTALHDGLVSQTDYEQNSQYVKGGAYYTPASYDTVERRDVGSMLNDLVYTSANPEEFNRVLEELNSIEDGQAATALAYADIIKYMTDEDRQDWFYIYNVHGLKEAEALLDASKNPEFNYHLYKQYNEEMVQKRAAEVGKNGWTAAAASVASVPETLLSQIAGAAALVNSVTGAEMHEYDMRFLWGDLSSTTRTTTGGMIANATEGVEILGINLGKMLYDGVMSAVDSAASTAMYGSFATVMMSADAYGRSYRENIAANGDPASAHTDAVMDAIIEAATEYFSVEGLMDDTVSSAWKALAKQMITEPSEEVFGELLRTGYNMAKYGEDSEISKQISNLVAMGYTESDAEMLVAGDFMTKLLETVLTSAVSGTAGGARSAVQQGVANYQTGDLIRQYAEDGDYEALARIARTVDLGKDEQKLLGMLESAMAAKAAQESSAEEQSQDEVVEQETVAQQEAPESTINPAEQLNQMSSQREKGDAGTGGAATTEQQETEAVNEQAEDLAEEVTENPVQNADNVVDKMTKAAKTKGAKQLSKAQLGRLYRATMQKLDQRAQDALRERMSFNVAKELKSYGVKGEKAQELAKSILRIQDGSFTKEDYEVVQNDSAARSVLAEWTKKLDAELEANIAVNKLAKLTAPKAKKEASISENETDVNDDADDSDGIRDDFDAVVADVEEKAANVQRSEDEASTYDGEEIEIVGVEQPEATEDGDVPMVKIRTADGSEQVVAADSVVYGTKDADTYQLAAYASTYGKDAGAMFAGYESGQNVTEYARAFNAAYTYGSDGRNLNVLANSGAINTVRNTVANEAYNLGREARNLRMQQSQNVRKMKGAGVKVGNVDTSAISKVQLTAHQRYSINAMRQLAPLLGINVKFVESVANAEGKYTTENGSWNADTRTLSLDIHAGSNYKSDFGYAMLDTVGHELTHYIKQFADAGLWSEYQDFVMSHLDTKLDLEAEIKNKMAQDDSLSRDDAIEEIIADASAQALSKVTDQQLADMAESNPSLVKRIANYIKNWIRNLKKQIRKAFATSGAKTNRFAEAMEDQLDAMAEKWNTLLALANQNAQATRNAAEAQEFSDADTKYAIREAEPPKHTIKAYKAFDLVDGKLYPPMVNNDAESLFRGGNKETKDGRKVSAQRNRGLDTPVGVWLDAEIGAWAKNDDGTPRTNTYGRLSVQNAKSKTQPLAFRPGWHLGEYPLAGQFVLADGTQRDDLVYCEVEMSADYNYQLQAMSYGMNVKGSGKDYDTTQAGLPEIPVDGYYKYRTNPTKGEPWYIAGSIRVTKILTDEECRKIVQEKTGGTVEWIPRHSGKPLSEERMGGLKFGDIEQTIEIEPYRASERGIKNAEELRKVLATLKGTAYVEGKLDFDSPKLQAAFESYKTGRSLEFYKELYEKQGTTPMKFEDDPLNDSETESDVKLSGRYDYSMPFSQRVDDWLAGKVSKDETILVCETPEVLQKIGLTSLPMTIDHTHMGYSLKGKYPKAQNRLDHVFDKEDFKRLPEKIKNPIAVIASSSKPNTSVVEIIHMKSINGKQAIAAVYVDKEGKINDIEMDTHAITTVHGRDNTLTKLLYEAVNNHLNGKTSLYYWNKKIAISLMHREGLQLPNTMPNDGYVSSILDKSSAVKPKITSQTETKQFRNWFKNSKIINADGSPKVMYHGSPNTFTVFDIKKAKSSGLYGKGFYFTDSDSHAGTYGNLYQVYLSVQNPLTPNGSTVTRGQVRKFLEAVANNEDDYSIENYGTYDVGEILNDVYRKDAFAVIQDVNATAIGDMVEAVKLFNAVNGTNFDGIVVDTETVVFEPTQIKSATDNIGTFDSGNPDIRYQLRDPYNASDRELLANALESLTTNADELDILRRYQSRIDKLNEKQEQLEATEARLKELRKAGYAENREEIIKLSNNARTLSASISRMDSDLLKLEVMGSIKKLADRQRKMHTRKIKAQMNAKAKEMVRTAKKETATKMREQFHEREGREKYRDRILSDAKKLYTWVTTPTNKGYVPDFLRKPLGDFIQSIDFSSKRSLKGGEATKRDIRMTDALDNLRRALASAHNQESLDNGAESFVGYIDLPTDYLQEFDDLVGKVKNVLAKSDTATETPFALMTSEQLKKLSEMIRILNSSVRNMNRLIQNGKYESAKTAADATITDMLNMRAKVKTNKALATLNTMFNWKNTTPFYAFQRMGEGGKAIFSELQDGWDKMAQNSAKLIEFAEAAFSAKQAKAWSKDIRDIKLSSEESVQMTVSQIMSLYCLNKRVQARGHLLGGGIRVSDIATGRGGTISQVNNYTLTQEDIDSIIGILTAEQKGVADKLQHFMNTQCTEWGNEISMKRFGYKMFTEDNYFPIESDSNNLRKIDDKRDGNNSMFRLLNMSAMKPLTEGANNALIVRDIFDVFSNHSSDIAKYNALALPILDFIKWYNYTEKTNVTDMEGNETGQITTRSTQKALEHAYGQDAKQYLMNFIKDMNAEHDGGRNDTFLSKLMGNAKAASVGANLRVYFLQITSLPRAAYAINPKYLLKGMKLKNLNPVNAIKGTEAQDKIGILKWKKLGFYNTDVAHSTRSMVRRDSGVMSKIRDIVMMPAGWGDNWTSNIIYEAVKAEMKDKHPNLQPGTAAYDTRLNQRVREVVYKTQVVDSTMTRSDFMRSKGLMTAFTAFMSEPTLTVNMLNESIQEAVANRRAGMKGSENLKAVGGKVVRAATTFAFTACFAALVESLFDAFRDDDDYEEFEEKFADALGGNITDNVNIFGMLPIIKDVVSIAQGYENNSMVTQVVDQFVDTKKAIEGWQKGDRPLYSVIYNMLKVVGSASGVGVQNATRDGVGLYNTFLADAWGTPKVQTYDDSKKDAATAFYNAVQEDDAEKAEWILERAAINGYKEEDFETNITTLVKNDYIEDEIDSKTAKKYLKDYAGKKEKDLDAQVLKWDYEKETGLKYGSMKEDYMSGKLSKTDAIKYSQKYGGQKPEAAKETVAKWEYEKSTGNAYGDIRDDYLSGNISESQLRKHLATVEGLDAEEIDERISRYDYYDYTGKTTNPPKYWRLAYTYETGGNYKAYADQLFEEIMAEGKSWKQARKSIASSLSSYYKEDYLAIKGTPAGDKMLEEILDVYEAIGWSRSYERNYIEKNWKPDED